MAYRNYHWQEDRKLSLKLVHLFVFSHSVDQDLSIELPPHPLDVCDVGRFYFLEVCGRLEHAFLCSLVYPGSSVNNFHKQVRLWVF